ncbi:hypothetical protein FCOIX_6250 [Fusarium coicis]|nr:hypothetical protein FCOIX_6250 [Fusarium coicis]
MSERGGLEGRITSYDETCKFLHENFTERFDTESDTAFSQTLEAVSQVRKMDHMSHSNKTKSAFEQPGQTFQENRIQTAALGEEYEAKLKAKDAEIKALKEAVNDLRENRRDKEDMIATTKEMHNLLPGQLQELKELHKAKEENMRLSMVEQKKKKAETRLEAGTRRKLLAHARFP